MKISQSKWEKLAKIYFEPFLVLSQFHLLLFDELPPYTPVCQGGILGVRVEGLNTQKI
jgi:hypothetical protein